MVASLTAWRSLLKIQDLAQKLPPPIPIEFLALTIPNISLEEWRLHGITKVQDFTSNSTIKSFEKIQKEIHIPPTTLFTYLRLKYGLSKIYKPLYAIPNSAWHFLSNSNQKGISLIYSILGSKKSLLQWEIDIKLIFTEWTNALKNIYKATSCSTLWELTQKISLKWYATPDKLATFYKQASHKCWRNYDQTGNILHILWECLVLQIYWQGYFTFSQW